MGYAGGMKQDQIKDRVRAVVERHSLPDFIVGYEVRLGEFDGDPALWVVFKMIPGPGRMTPEIDRRVKAMSALEAALLPGLLEAFEDGSIYFHYEANRSRVPVAE
jgi:hypothetical protein